jgi:hypothetical protein
MAEIQMIGSIATGAVAGGAAGGLVIFLLKNWWLERLKASYAAELASYKATLDGELKQIQSNLDHRIFVSKAHYETEFESMKAIFSSATQAYFLILEARPMFSYGSSDETKESKLENLSSIVNQLSAAHDSFVLQTESLMPYYPESLRMTLIECAVAIRKEIGDIRSSGPDSLRHTGYLKASENQEAFQQSYFAAARIIRERIERLVILN